MDIISIIAKKRDQQQLTDAEIRFFVHGAVDGSIANYQVTALLMAIRINGFSVSETASLTDAMTHSGRTLDLSDVDGTKVDKHSTGGVGDKTSLILLPIAAAAGLVGAKMSGRGLGHTGGTLDKLESIPGLRVDLPTDAFKRQLRQIGLAIISQSEELVPADKLFYALRDVTATVDSIPLITASIISKKLATGADVLVLDVKYGSGALIRERERSRELARMMVNSVDPQRLRAAALLSSMEQPLGHAVGNALEVREALQVLEGDGPDDLRQTSLAIAAEQIYLAGLRKTPAEALSLATELLDSGAAREKFIAMVRAQGGDADFTHLPQATQQSVYHAAASGWVCDMDTRLIGEAAAALGAGRQRAEDAIDPAAGLIMPLRIGDQVRQGEAVAELHCNNADRLEQARALLDQALLFSAERPPQTAEQSEIIRPGQ